MTLDPRLPGPERRVRAVGISGSPSATSRSRRLLEHALDRLAECGAGISLVDLSGLPADALLGRSPSRALDAGRADVLAADVVVASTPVYRATYSGLLKVFFDLLPRDGLNGAVGVPLAPGALPEHRTVLERGLRPLFESLGARVVGGGVYATDAGLPDGVPTHPLLERIDRAVAEALELARLPGAAPITLRTEVSAP